MSLRSTSSWRHVQNRAETGGAESFWVYLVSLTWYFLPAMRSSCSGTAVNRSKLDPSPRCNRNSVHRGRSSAGLRDFLQPRRVERRPVAVADRQCGCEIEIAVKEGSLPVYADERADDPMGSQGVEPLRQSPQIRVECSRLFQPAAEVSSGALVMVKRLVNRMRTFSPSSLR